MNYNRKMRLSKVSDAALQKQGNSLDKEVEERKEQLKQREKHTTRHKGIKKTKQDPCRNV